ncbi:MAG: hypothetical protein AAGH15_00180 [Myxococcota bacterium]
MVGIRTRCIVSFVVALAGCGAPIDAPELEAESEGTFRGADPGASFVPGAIDVTAPPEVPDDAEVVLADVPPPPLYGGTLTLSADRRRALAARPRADRVHVVDVLGFRRDAVATLDLPSGSQPWRSVAVADGWVLSLRDHGVARVRFTASSRLELAWLVTVPGAVRGVDVDPVAGEVWVATAGGELASLALADGAALTTHVLVPDLRDVVVGEDGDVFVSRFRSTEVLRVRDGVIAQRALFPAGLDGRAPRVAWRMRRDGEGRLVMLRQLHLQALASSAEPRPPSSGYSRRVTSGGTRGPTVARPQVIRFDDALDFLGEEPRVSATAFAVDMATGTRGDAIALAVPGDATVLVLDDTGTHSSPALNQTGSRLGERGLISSVAFRSEDDVVYQTAGEPRVASPSGSIRVRLGSSFAFDAGFVFFHEGHGTSGVACASCHPDGSDDGHVWTFPDGRSRRTQPLGGGILGSEPFHWDGSEPDMTHIVAANMTLMGAPHVSPAVVDAVGRWMDALPPDPPAAVADEALARAGGVVFRDAGCTGCHDGARLSDGESHELAEGTLSVLRQTPSLLGVGLREGLMSDGCMPSVDAFGDAECADRHHAVTHLSEADLEALRAFLRTL